MQTRSLAALAALALLVAGCSKQADTAPSAASSPKAEYGTPAAAPASAAPAAVALTDADFERALVVKGSDTLGEVLVPRLAEAFKTQQPRAKFDITAEGSTTGIMAVINGAAPIGMSSRPAKPTEISLAKAQGVALTPVTVAFDGIPVIVNAANPITKLTAAQVEKIFAGDITDWAELGGSPAKIAIFTRNTSSGTYGVFKEIAMNKRDYAPSTQKMDGNEQIAAEVAKNPHAIGYAGVANLHSEGVKAVAVDGHLPNETEIRSKSYPLSRPLLYYVNGTPSGLAAAFIDFTLSPEGQKVVRDVGFIPVK